MKVSRFVLILLSLIAIGVVGLLATGCDRQRVEEAPVRDFLFSVEPTVTGTWGVFLTHDDSIVYCTADPELGRKATHLLYEHSGEVLLTFATREWFKDSGGELFGLKGCQNYSSADGTGFNTVILLSIEGVPARNGYSS